MQGLACNNAKINLSSYYKNKISYYYKKYFVIIITKTNLGYYNKKIFPTNAKSEYMYIYTYIHTYIFIYTYVYYKEEGKFYR